MTNPNLFNTLLVWPILNLLMIIYHGVIAIHIPYALGISIILLTALFRLVLSPFMAAQIKTTAKMQELTPHLNKLKEKHKNDAKMLQSETMRLYREYGVNPLAGCLPALLQIPIAWGLYNMLTQVVSAKPALLISEINKVVYFPFLKVTQPIDLNFFGLNLGHTPSTMWHTFGVAVLLVPLFTAVFQFVQSKMMFAPVVPVEKNKDKKDSEDMAAAFQAQSMYIIPLVIGYLSFSFPIGLSLYWNTFTIFGILQQYQVQGWGGMQDWIDKLKRK